MSEQTVFQFDRLAAKALEYHAANPRVYDLFESFTIELVCAGRRHYSAKAIFERIRWHYDVETTGDEFKLNNNYPAYYARWFMDRHPEHEGFFHTRRLAA